MSALVETAAGMSHLGVLYDGPDDLVDSVAPHLDRALERGYTVSTLVDRRTARRLRDALGDRAGALTFGSPHEAADGADLLRRLRRTVVDAEGRALVLTQYSAFATAAEEIALTEAGINVVLGDLPFTMLCACSRDAAPPLVDVLCHSHPGWVAGPTTRDNPGFRPPDDRSPTPSALWGGTHVLRLHFGTTADLARVRTHVAALAAEVGLRGEPAQAAVFAVHEAAVLACEEAAPTGACADVGRAAPETAAAPPDARPAAVRRSPGVDDPCVLDVWTAGSRLVAQVQGPRAPGGPPAIGSDADRPGGGGADEPRLPRNRLRMAGPLRLVRSFCRDVTTSETAGGRTTRVVTGP